MSDLTRLADELRVAVARLSRRIRHSRVDPDLGMQHYSALGSLIVHGPSTLARLAECEQVTSPSMLKTVRCLEDHGYVSKRDHETDGRKQLIEITPVGHEMLDRTRAVRNERLSARLATLTDDERATIRAAIPLLTRLTED